VSITSVIQLMPVIIGNRGRRTDASGAEIVLGEKSTRPKTKSFKIGTYDTRLNRASIRRESHNDRPVSCLSTHLKLLKSDKQKPLNIIQSYRLILRSAIREGTCFECNTAVNNQLRYNNNKNILMLCTWTPTEI
jgi:hypothetical protein